MIKNPLPELTIALLANDVATEHSVTAEQILGYARDKKTVTARHDFYWRLHQKGHAYAEIGRKLGKHHTTILSGVRDHQHKTRKSPECSIASLNPNHSD